MGWARAGGGAGDVGAVEEWEEKSRGEEAKREASESEDRGGTEVNIAGEERCMLVGKGWVGRGQRKEEDLRQIWRERLVHWKLHGEQCTTV